MLFVLPLSEFIGLQTLFDCVQIMFRRAGGAIECPGRQGVPRENAGCCTESPGLAALGEETSRRDGGVPQVRSKKIVPISQLCVLRYSTLAI